MNERDAESKRTGEFEGHPVSAGSNLPRSMDPNYSTHTGPYPWDHPAPSSAGSRPTMQAGDFAWIQAWHDKQAAKLKAELRFQLEVMPSGQRIRTLRAVLGWTQRMAAEQLEISVRTVIRHEHSQHRTWLRLPVLLRLRELESVYAEQIIAYLTHKPVRT